MQDVDGGPGVVERPVGGADRGPADAGESRELDVRRFVAGEDPAGELDGVEHADLRPGHAEPGAGRPEVADVEGRVVGHEDRVGAGPEELHEGGEDFADSGRRERHGGGDARQSRDEGGDGLARVDEGRELAERLASAHPDRADIRYRVGRGPAAGRLQVDDDEGRFLEGHAQIVEGELGAARRRAADPRAERIVVCHASSVSGGSDAFRFAAGLTAGRRRRRDRRPRRAETRRTRRWRLGRTPARPPPGRWRSRRRPRPARPGSRPGR